MLKHMIQRLWRCERGATLVEYGIAVALAITVGSAGLIMGLGNLINARLEAVSALM